MAGNLGAIDKEAGIVTRSAILDLQTRTRLMEETIGRFTRNATVVANHSDLQQLDYASSGHTGFTSTVIFAAHTTASNHPYTDSAKTWTAEQTFNAGIDMGTSGRIDSNVADAASATSFLVQPTVAQTSGFDRYIAQVKNSSGTPAFTVYSNGAIAFGNVSGSSALLNVTSNNTLTFNSGMLFNASFQAAGSTIAGVGSAISGVNFAPTLANAFGTNTSAFGAAFVMTGSSTAPGVDPPTPTQVEFYGAVFSASRNHKSNVTTNLGGISIRNISHNTVGTCTNARGIRIEDFSSSIPSATLTYGMHMAEITRGVSTSRFGILLEQTNAGYKAAAFRDANAFINSDASGDLDLNATANIDVNVNSVRVGSFSTTDIRLGATAGSDYLLYTHSTDILSFVGAACIDDVPSSGGTTDWIFTSNRGDATGVPNAFVFKAAQSAITPLITNHTLWKNAAGNTILTLTGLGSFQTTVDFTQPAGSTWAIGEGVNAVLGTSTGTKIGTGASQLLGFWNKTPVAQYSTTGTTTGHTAGASATHILLDDTFTGNTGSTAYTIGDIVRGLKLCGIIAA